MTPTGRLKLVAKPHGHGGYSPWRASHSRGSSRSENVKSFTEYMLCHAGRAAGDAHRRVELRLGTLHTGVRDEGLAEFWGRAIYAMRKYGLDEPERREIAHELQRAGVPLPASTEWPGLSGRGGAWEEIAAEVSGLAKS